MAHNKGPSILCLRCHMRSFNLNDVEHKFCGCCGVFHQSPATYELGESRDKRLAAIDAALRHGFRGAELERVRAALKTYGELLEDSLRHAFDRFPQADFTQFAIAAGRLLLDLDERARKLRNRAVEIDMLTHTYTTVILELSDSAFSEIRTKLLAAGYAHALSPDGTIDMTGFAVCCSAPEDAQTEGERT